MLSLPGRNCVEVTFMYSSNERMAQRRTTVDFSRTGWQQFSKLNRKLGKRFLQAFVLRRELAEYLAAHEAAGVHQSGRLWAWHD